MDCYNFVIAKAHKIVKHQCWKELEGNNILANEDNNSNTNSKLLVLVSSLFNSIDSLEYSSIGGSNINSSKLNSSNNSTSTLEIAFSLKMMRLSKVVKYYNKK